VVLYRARERHHAQYFATTAWPGYPVVNPTMLGSRGAGSMAAAWAVLEVLGTDGLAELVAATRRATDRVVEAAGTVRGLRVVGHPTGPLVALATDDSVPVAERVDPFLLVDEARRRGWLLQAQPAMAQPDGSVLPRTAHLTITAVTHTIVDELVEVLAGAADAVRGLPAAGPDPSLAGRVLTEGLPDELAGVMATLEALPGEVVHPLLIAVLAAAIDPALG
jgi:glutamate/tyrosine decarboxylase-like PLP-dependent enzyme